MKSLNFYQETNGSDSIVIILAVDLTLFVMRSREARDGSEI